MQITSRFTIAVHMITAIDYFGETEAVTSGFLAGSIGANPVIVRNVMGNLKEAGIISISQGKSGIELAKPLEEITFYDIYQAVDCVKGEGLFHFHEQPNPECPVGRNIHRVLDRRLLDAQRAMEDTLKSATLADIAEDTKKAIHQEWE